MNTWHTTIMLIRYSINGSIEVEEDPVPWINIWLGLAIGALSFIFMRFIILERSQLFSEIWLVIRFFVEIYFLFLMFYFVRKQKKGHVHI